MSTIETETTSGCPVTDPKKNESSMTLQGDESLMNPLIRNNPFAFYKALRENQPVYYDKELDLYLVTRYDDVMEIMRDPITFSMEHGYQDRYANGFVEELAEIMDRDGGGFVRDVFAVDPPKHTRLRKLLEKAFTAHRVKSLEPRFRQIIIDLIEPLAERGSGDGMLDIGAPLTANIICEQLGFDYNEVGTEKIARWTTAHLSQIGRMQTHEEMLKNAKDMCEMQNYIIPHLHARKTEPREDMLSDLVHARIDDKENPTLSFMEQLSLARALLVAGNDTTAAALANVMMVFAHDPDLVERLYESVDDDRFITRFVEEVLRLEPPVHGLFRTATKDVTVGGVDIPAFSQICTLFASANDDESKFACPRTLDIQRSNVGTNLTFGAGIHRCIGASLARMEIKVTVQEVVRRLTNIKLAVPPEDIQFIPSLATHTIINLPLTFSRRQ